MAVAGGVATIVTGVITRRRREEIAETYAITGGVVYTVAQFGCGGVLIVSGLVLVIAVLVNAH